MPADDAIIIPNHHTPGCGKPPSWVRERDWGSHFGYFENEFGEQWVFHATREFAELAGGDAGWEHVFRIENPDWTAVDQWLFGKADLEANAVRTSWPGILLEGLEAAWLRMCVLTAAQRFIQVYEQGPDHPHLSDRRAKARSSERALLPIWQACGFADGGSCSWCTG